ncbi:MAG: SDR family NAD(P)-dependent oxidoreductase [Flavobacteriales bacterium]|nr:SDR family NAD(P)-dependent oxidoreductase [Flavobacteriales bacterium]
MSVKNKIILITGASSGIGAASAKLLASKGAIVVLQARGEANLNKVATVIQEKGGLAHVYPVDLTKYVEVNAVAERVISEVGLPDVIINGAGAGHWLSIFESQSQDFEEQMAAPYYAAAYTTKAFIDQMKERDSGHIININSIACYFNIPGAIGYVAARHAMRGFSSSLYTDLHHTNLHASMIAAGKVDTAYFENNPGSAERIPKISTTLVHTMSVDEVARAVLRTIKTRKKVVVIPFMMRVFVTMNRFVPGFFDMLSRWTGYRAN